MAPQPHPINGGPQSQPTVRHIPIFVEGRDEPIINRNIEIPSMPEVSIKTTLSSEHVPPSGGNTFDRAKHFPKRFSEHNQQHADYQQAPHQRGASPLRSVPITIKSTARQSPSPGSSFTQSPHQNQQHNYYPRSTKSSSPLTEPLLHTRPSTPSTSVPNTATPPTTIGQPSEQLNKNQNQSQQQQQMGQGHSQQSMNNLAVDSEKLEQDANNIPLPKRIHDPIDKIQTIQRDILALMDLVEHFDGTSKIDKQYLYLDEMLTQNLLKLDTIDTDGKDNIKQARREAIKCINKCIAVLEAKTDAAERSMSSSSLTAKTSSSTDSVGASKKSDNIKDSTNCRSSPLLKSQSNISDDKKDVLTKTSQ